MVQNTPNVVDSPRMENRIGRSAEPPGQVEYYPIVVQRAWWGALIAGVVAALALQTLLSVLGMAIGLSTIDPEAGDGVAGVGLGAGIWWALASVLSLFFGGWVAGRLTGLPRTLDGALHGMLVWGVVTVLTVWLVTSAASRLIGGTMSALQSAAPRMNQDALQSAAGDAAGALGLGSAQSQEAAMDWTPIENEVRLFVIQRAGAGAGDGNGGDQAMEKIVQSLRENMKHGRALQPQERDEIVSVVTSQTGADRSQAEAQIDHWAQTYQQQHRMMQQRSPNAEQDMRQEAGEVTNNLAGASWWTFAGLLLGCAAATIGGGLGVRTTTDPVLVNPDKTQHRG